MNEAKKKNSSKKTIAPPTIRGACQEDDKKRETPSISAAFFPPSVIALLVQPYFSFDGCHLIFTSSPILNAISGSSSPSFTDGKGETL